MLGRYQVPGHCAGSRAARFCVDCGGGESMGARGAKRIEARGVAREIASGLDDYETGDVVPDATSLPPIRGSRGKRP